MCERYTLYARTLEQTQFALVRSVLEDAEGFERTLRPRYNIAPGAMVPIVRKRPGEFPALIKARWGLVPRTSETPATELTTHHARAETVATSRLYGGSLRRMRCLVPASGWYAFKSLAKHGGREGYDISYVRPRKACEICFAGIWERWGGTRAEAFESFSIITVPQNGLLGHVHRRLPAIVDPAEYRAWLDPGLRAIEPITAMIQSPVKEAYSVSIVSDRVVDPRHDDETLIAPMAAGHESAEQRWAAAMDYTEDELQTALARIQLSPFWRERILDLTPRELLRIARELERKVPKRPV